MGRQRYGRLILALMLFGALCSLGCESGGSSSTPPYVPPEMTDGSTPDLDFEAMGFNETLNGHDWIEQMLFGAPNRADPRLPNYAYFQGLIQAGDHVVVAGQVRVVGGVVGADSGVASLYAGGMITTNPYAFTGAEGLTGGPPGIRTRIGHWEEIQGE